MGSFGIFHWIFVLLILGVPAVVILLLMNRKR